MTTAIPESLACADLVARLAHAPPGSLTVVTPNHRLAQALARAVAEIHLAAGCRSWPAPDILAWDAWLARLHDDASFDDRGAPASPLLSADHERVGWEGAIARDPGRPMLVGPAALAREARAAWTLAHDWEIAGALGSWESGEDARAFARWADLWKTESSRRGWLDGARLPDLVPDLLARAGVRKPALLVAYAFHIETPAQRRVLDACRAAGIQVAVAVPPDHDATPVVVPAESPRRELELAARWARARLEGACGKRTPRIAVVVPDLAQRRELVRRIFSRVFSPSGKATGASLFNVSLGKPLADYPLVDAALAILDLASGPVAFERASRVLRSPFLGGAHSEYAARARADASLRRTAPPFVGLESLRELLRDVAGGAGRQHAPECTALEARLTAVAAIALPGKSAPPRAWAAHYAALLAAAGFPGERVLDSAEHQALEKWNEALARFAALGFVAATLAGEAARRHLRQACIDTVFQPESGDAPVQVLGLLESVGLEFDALWVTGLTDDAWPQSPRPHPFLPVSLQRKAGIAQASAEASLALDRRITQSWARAAVDVVFSHGLLDEDRALAASPLIAPWARVDAGSLGIPDYAGLGAALHAAGRDPAAWAGREDGIAPPPGAAPARGGTAILADQAACPFRAFARHRLHAQSLEKMEPGLGPAERGQLLHAVMARVWRDLGSHATLVSLAPEQLAALVATGARVAVAKLRAERPGRLDGRFADLERERLAIAALAWLDIDRSRAPFEVVLREGDMVLEAGGLQLRGRIDRLDRLAGGGLAVIDYKTGSPRVAGWLGERPEDPQLPLYALSLRDEVAAVAFACLKSGKVGFAGLAREEGLLPGVPTVDQHRVAGKFAASWNELLKGWQRATARLAEGYLNGDARVDPKRPFATCEHCDLGPLCRVHEHAGAFGADDDAPKAEGDDE